MFIEEKRKYFQEKYEIECYNEMMLQHLVEVIPECTRFREELKESQIAKEFYKSVVDFIDNLVVK